MTLRQMILLLEPFTTVVVKKICMFKELTNLVDQTSIPFTEINYIFGTNN